jgi:elongation factor G
MVLWGQGGCTCAWRWSGSSANTAWKNPKPRQLPHKETIRKGIEIRGRHKKQSGGHGQFGDG